MNVDEIMTTTVQTTSPDATIKEAAKKMSDYRIGSLIVQDGDEVVGIITESDVIGSVAEGDVEDAVGDHMSSPITVIAAGSSLEHAMEVMTEHKVKHLPVLDGEELVGMVSATDVLKQGEAALENLSTLFMTQRSLLPAGS